MNDTTHALISASQDPNAGVCLIAFGALLVAGLGLWLALAVVKSKVGR